MVEPAQVWQLGDYATVGGRWAAAGDVLVNQLVASGDRVLDVACGPGTMAVTAARSGAVVTGLDISPSLLATAGAHAAHVGVLVDWVEHDMTKLPFPAASFDGVLSAFGCMFAPDPVAMAQELHRVCAPGGVIGVLAWEPTSTIGRFGPLARPYLPRDAHGPAIEDWGRPEMTSRFFAGLGEVTTTVHTVDIAWPSLETAVDELTTLVPGWVLIKTMLTDGEWRKLRTEVAELMVRTGHTSGGEYVLPTRYLATRVNLEAGR